MIHSFGKRKTESISITHDKSEKTTDIRIMKSYCEKLKEKLFSSQIKNYKMSITLKEKDEMIEELLKKVESLKQMNLELSQKIQTGDKKYTKEGGKPFKSRYQRREIGEKIRKGKRKIVRGISSDFCGKSKAINSIKEGEAAHFEGHQGG